MGLYCYYIVYGFVNVFDYFFQLVVYGCSDNWLWAGLGCGYFYSCCYCGFGYWVLDWLGVWGVGLGVFYRVGKRGGNF